MRSPTLVVAQGVLGAMVEHKIAKVGVGVEAADIGLAKLHEYPNRAGVIVRILQFVGADYGIVIGVVHREHLLHFEFLTWSPRDDPLGPIVEGVAFFAPVFLFRIPDSLLLQA